MNSFTPFVRAGDVGYGHIKFSEGRSAAGQIITSSIPSQSPIAEVLNTSSGATDLVMNRRDTFRVPVGGRIYEVGRDVRFALHSRHESEVLDNEFATSPSYAARLFGALNYMLPGLPDHTIDVLVLGLPMTTYAKHQAALAQRFAGTHVINERGATVNIKSCYVFPQPLGSYAAVLAESWEGTTTPTALIIDPGYNTVDWFVCHGMTAHGLRSDAVERGMGAVLRAIAEDIIRKYDFDATTIEVIRLIDASLVGGTPFVMYGQQFDLKEHIKAGESIFDEAAQAIKNSVASAADIDTIVMSGGGADLYASVIADKFPRHKVVTLKQPALANVRGFQILGEKIAASRGRASPRSADGVPA